MTHEIIVLIASSIAAADSVINAAFIPLHLLPWLCLKQKQCQLSLCGTIAAGGDIMILTVKVDELFETVNQMHDDKMEYVDIMLMEADDSFLMIRFLPQYLFLPGERTLLSCGLIMKMSKEQSTLMINYGRNEFRLIICFPPAVIVYLGFLPSLLSL